jgi:hypothetical protein
MKRLEKEKAFSNSYSAVGRNSAGSRARPGQPLHFPSPFLHSRMAQPNRPSLPGLSRARSPRAAQQASNAAQAAYRVRLASQCTPDKISAHQTRYRPDPLSTRYRPGIEFISKPDSFPPSNPAPIFMIWLRFLKEIDWSPPRPQVRRIFSYK